MIFDAALAQARQKLKLLAKKREELIQARAWVADLLPRYERYQEEFEFGLAHVRQSGETQYLPTHSVTRAGIWTVNWYLISPGDQRRAQSYRAEWDRALERLRQLRDKFDRKIAELKERILRLEIWLADKQATWGAIDPQKLRGQVRDVLQAAEQLSQLLLKRNVPIVFDTREESPLGYVPISREKKTGRKVYLSARILSEQPEHLLDYYQALIVHELGHLLLHLKDSGQDYRRLRRLLREKVSLAPRFFNVFNILLDEQLERVLRDTTPEWQRWFNRFDFYTRRVPLQQMRTFLLQNGHADPERSIAELSARGLVKVYADPSRPFAAIQSAAVFSEAAGFDRLYAFYAVLRHRLPLATVQQAWLKECLGLIPKNFKTQDVFEVHALAVAIYKILIGHAPGRQFLTVKIKRSAGEGEIEIPGAWLPGHESASGRVVVWSLRRKPSRGRRRGGSDGQGQADNPNASSQLDPEGAPPPPPPPTCVPPPSRPPRVRPVQNVFGGRGKPVRIRSSAAWADRDRAAAAKARARPGGKNFGKGKKQQGKQAVQEQRRVEERTAAREARKQTRRAKADRANARRRVEAPRPSPPEQRPSPSAPAPPSSTADVQKAATVAAEKTPSWSSRNAMCGIQQELNRVLQEVRAERAAERSPTPSIEKMVPDAGQPVDHRNEADERVFPGPDLVLRLLPNRASNLMLTKEVQRFVSILRPYLGVADPEKVLQERLTGGKRLLASGLTNHLAYGEPRLFADLRLTEADQHAEVLIGVLIDTSASMKKDGRLERAKGLAALLSECLKDCPHVESVFLGYNQNIYQCGCHDGHSLGSLEPAGKTNEAAALDYLRQHHLGLPRRRKVVVVLSDGQPTICSLEAVRWLVRAMEKAQGVRFLYAALSAAEHPAYRRRTDLNGEIDNARVRRFGRALAALLR